MQGEPPPKPTKSKDTKKQFEDAKKRHEKGQHDLLKEMILYDMKIFPHKMEKLRKKREQEKKKGRWVMSPRSDAALTIIVVDDAS